MMAGKFQLATGSHDPNSLSKNAELEEELEEVPLKEMERDELYQAEITKSLNDRTYTGIVTTIDVGADSGERLYLVEYNDGEVEHFTAEEIRTHLVQVAAKKRPAAAGATEAMVDEDEEEEEVEKAPKKAKVTAKKATPAKAAPAKATPAKATPAALKKPAAAMKDKAKPAMKDKAKPAMKDKATPEKKAKAAKPPAMKKAAMPMKKEKPMKKPVMKAVKKPTTKKVAAKGKKGGKK